MANQYQVEVTGTDKIPREKLKQKLTAISRQFGSTAVEFLDRRGKIPATYCGLSIESLIRKGEIKPEKVEETWPIFDEARLYFIFLNGDNANNFRYYLSHRSSLVSSAYVREV